MARGAFDETVSEMEKRLTKGLKKSMPQRPEPRGGKIPEQDMSAPQDLNVGGTQQRTRVVQKLGKEKRGFEG